MKVDEGSMSYPIVYEREVARGLWIVSVPHEQATRIELLEIYFLTYNF